MDVVVDFVAETLEDLVDHSVEDQVGDVVVVGMFVDLEILIPWYAIGVGSVAIWPGIAPTPATSRWEVVQLALPVEHFPNLGKKVHNMEKDEFGKSGSLVSMHCMTMKVTLTPLMMQDSCMCLWTLGRLLPSLLRRKWEKKQKTKKILCQCGNCYNHIVFKWHWIAKRKQKLEGNL